MIYFLSIQNTYQNVEIALFKDSNIVATSSLSKIQASSHIMPAIQELLQANGLTFKDLSFIGTNQGPGPFTTLRVVIATVNGISFATGIPLIGVDGLDTFLDEYKDPAYPVTVALLNAFNQDAYFGVDALGTREKGCKNNEQLLQEIKERYTDHTIRFIGSGVSVFKDQIQTIFGSHTFFPEPMPEQCSVRAVGLQSLQQWQSKKETHRQLLPLYLKGQVVKGKDLDRIAEKIMDNYEAAFKKLSKS